MSEHLADKKPSLKPIRKVRWAAYASAALTIVTYLVTAAQGDAVVSQEAFNNAVGVLSASVVPVLMSWLAKAGDDE